MKHIDSVRAGIQYKIAQLQHEILKYKKFLTALDSIDAAPPTKKKKAPKGFTKQGKPRQRVRHVRVKTTCKMCGRTFIAQRHPGGKRPVLFCHKPCTSNRYQSEQLKKNQQWKEKGVPIVKGDPLTAAHPSH